MRYWSFSSAGWFCRLGERDESRPVSVLRFSEQCTRDSASARSRRGLMNVLSIVSMEPMLHSASRATQASSPAGPPPKPACAAP